MGKSPSPQTQRRRVRPRSREKLPLRTRGARAARSLLPTVMPRVGTRLGMVTLLVVTLLVATPPGMVMLLVATRLEMVMLLVAAHPGMVMLRPWVLPGMGRLRAAVTAPLPARARLRVDGRAPRAAATKRLASFVSAVRY